MTTAMQRTTLDVSKAIGWPCLADSSQQQRYVQLQAPVRDDELTHKTPGKPRKNVSVSFRSPLVSQRSISNLPDTQGSDDAELSLPPPTGRPRMSSEEASASMDEVEASLPRADSEEGIMPVPSFAYRTQKLSTAHTRRGGKLLMIQKRRHAELAEDDDEDDADQVQQPQGDSDNDDFVDEYADIGTRGKASSSKPPAKRNNTQNTSARTATQAAKGRTKNTPAVSSSRSRVKPKATNNNIKPADGIAQTRARRTSSVTRTNSLAEPDASFEAPPSTQMPSRRHH